MKCNAIKETVDDTKNVKETKTILKTDDKLVFSDSAVYWTLMKPQKHVYRNSQ
jgi:hypothetical protein